MCSNIPYHKLQNLLDFFLKFPTQEQLLVYMNENISPVGEIVEVFTGYLGEDGWISNEFSYGVSISRSFISKVKISDQAPSARALRTMKIVLESATGSALENSTVLHDYPAEGQLVNLVLPATTRRIYGFKIMGKTEDLAKFSSYFECLRSILSFWEFCRENLILNKVKQYHGENRELTSRQKRILELIKLERTNSAIALLLVYSESLIRQETIAIYRKLGISGRRGLKKSLVS